MFASEKYWRRRIFAVTWLAYAGFYLCRKNFAVAMPVLAEELGSTKLDFATVIFVYSLFYAVGQFTNALASDRFGARLVVGIGMMVSAASTFAMGFAGTLLAFTLLAPVNGLGQSAGWSGLVKTMASWFRPRERGVVMGWWGTSFVLGGSFATVFATFWIANETFLATFTGSGGWRRAFFFPALALAGLAVAFLILVRNRPADVGLDTLDGETSPSRRATTTTSLLRTTLAEPALWAIAAMYFFLKSTRYAFLFWLPLYLSEALSYPFAEAGYTSALYELVGFSGAIFAGYVSDKLMGSRRFPVGSVMLLALALVLFLHPVFSSEGPFAVAAWISLVGILTYGPDTLMSGAAAQDVGGGSATAAGIVNGVGSIGQLLSPLIVGYVAYEYGWDRVFSLFVVFALAGATILATQWNYRPREIMESPAS
ncbi:MAG: MFS transporter [Acidobacteriota bacterium]|nr:MAG: MFS transporter [Acidobacteriota bacterium]